MTLRHMRIFVMVCECGSTTTAAERLFLAQPAVSLAIRELESYYGVRLFDRISKRLYITEQGKHLLNYAKHIIDLFDEMEKSIKNLDSIGELRIGSSITIGNHLLLIYINALKALHPETNVRVIIDNSEEIEKRIIANTIDIALIEGLVHNEQILFEKFKEDQLVLICGKNHPLHKINEIEIKELTKFDFILREKGSGSRELFDSLMNINEIKVDPIWESISTQAIIRAVIDGIGLTVLPLLMAEQYIAKGEVHEIKIANTSLHRDYYIIYHKNKYLTKLAKEFISICQRDCDEE